MTASQKDHTLLCSLISAGASVAVALVGILPMLRDRDRRAIEELARERDDLRTRFDLEPPDPAQPARWTIRGRVRQISPGDGQGPYEVYLVPGNKHVASPSDDGAFVFEEVFPASYSLIVRDMGSSSSRTARALIEPGKPSGRLESHGARVEYSVDSQPTETATAATGVSAEAAESLAAERPRGEIGGLP